MSDLETVAAWMIERGYATGHGDSVADLLRQLDWQIMERITRAFLDGHAKGQRDDSDDGENEWDRV